MQAVTQYRYGGPEALTIETRPVPEPKSDEVLIRVAAASVTTADWRLRSAAYPEGMGLIGRMVSGLFKPRHEIPGVDVSGEIVAVGSKVTRFRRGEAVFGFIDHGAQAEYVAVKETAALARKPDALSHAEAVTLPFGATTAYDFLIERGQLAAGERVLVTGASGGVGYFAVQIAKAAGAHVTALASGENAGFLTGLGADVVVDYHATDIRESTDRYDVVFDGFGLLTAREALQLLKDGGRHLIVSGELTTSLSALRPKRSRGRRLVFAVSMATPERLAKLAAMVVRGAIRPVIQERFPLSRIAEAHALVETRHSTGTVVIDVRPEHVQDTAYAA